MSLRLCICSSWRIPLRKASMRTASEESTAHIGKQTPSGLQQLQRGHKVRKTGGRADVFSTAASLSLRTRWLHWHRPPSSCLLIKGSLLHPCFFHLQSSPCSSGYQEWDAGPAGQSNGALLGCARQRAQCCFLKHVLAVDGHVGPRPLLTIAAHQFLPDGGLSYCVCQPLQDSCGQ